MSTVINKKRKQDENYIRISTKIKNLGGFSEYLDITYSKGSE